MSSRFSMHVVLLVLVAAIAGCSSKKDGESQAAAAEPETKTPQVNEDGTLGEKIGENRWRIPVTTKIPESMDSPEDIVGGAGGGLAKKRNDETPLYVDGEARAMLRFAEIPPWLDTTWKLVGSNTNPVYVMRFNLADYLALIGVDIRKVKELHAYGGRGRVARMKGDALRRAAKKFLFSFSGGVGGKARLHWIPEVGATDSIDKIRQIAVYVDKTPPTWDREQWSFVDETGQMLPELPFVEEKLRGGIRVLLDARIATVIKRKKLIEEGVEPSKVSEDVPFYVLFDLLKLQEVDTSKVVAIELLNRNDVVGRLEGPALEAAKKTLEVSVPPKAKGHLFVHLPGAEAVEVTAVSMLTRRHAKATHVRPLEAPPLPAKEASK